MAMAALASRGTDDDLRNSQYKVLELWRQSYNNELLIMLPDTFGTSQFLAHAPAWAATWTGERIDSKDPFVAGDEYIAWLESRGQDPHTKRLIASDGLDASTIVQLHAYFDQRIRFSAGWGTLLTNDFRGCHPRNEDTFEPISLVCKLTSADGIPTVKLSDNPSKSTGPADLIARYRRVLQHPSPNRNPRPRLTGCFAPKKKPVYRIWYTGHVKSIPPSSMKRIHASFFRTAAGGEPVREWLKSLQPIEDRKRIGVDIKTVEFGWPIGMPVCRPLKDGLYEVRTNLSSSRIARVLFYVDIQNRMILLHGFIKKKQRAPAEDMDLARKINGSIS